MILPVRKYVAWSELKKVITSMVSCRHFTAIFLICCLLPLSACRGYVVGIAPVYTEERRDNAKLTYRERYNIEQGYYDAVKESRKFSEKVVSPLALECTSLLGGLYYNRDKFLRPCDLGLDYTREFYRRMVLVQPPKRKEIIDFMLGNGINLLFTSSYDYSLQKEHYRQVKLKVFYLVPGGGSLEYFSDSFKVSNFRDYQLLRRESTDALRRVLDDMERR